MPQKTPRTCHSDVEWFALFLRREAGASCAEIARLANVTLDTVYHRISRIRRLTPAERNDLRERAFECYRCAAEAELLDGDPLKAQRLFNAAAGARRAEREARKSLMENRDATPGDTKEAELTDAEAETLRARLYRRHVLRLPDEPESEDAQGGHQAAASCPGRGLPR